MNPPWRWSEDGLQLIDGTGRTVLKICPSDATQQEFDAIRMAPELVTVAGNVLNYAEQTGNCSICGQDFGDHEEDCPYPEADNALDQITE